jgi:TolA-binding protein
MRTLMVKAVLMAGLSLLPMTVHAQSTDRGPAIEGRVDRLESEMRAVQRKVFPGGAGQYVQPDNSPEPAATDVPGSPSANPVTDLNARVNALESQMNGMTSQIETTSHKLQQLEDAFIAYKRSTDARLKALEETASSTTSATVAEPAPAKPAPGKPTGTGSPKPGATGSGTPAKPGTSAATKPDRAPTPASKDPARGAKLAAIEKPSTGDEAEDTYLYGYRLWSAKLYPEAETQLQSVATGSPKHKRASYAQTLLGRAYLDDGMPARAALALYKSYKSFPDGDRAPDALFYLADALRKAGKPPADVCQVYAELSDVYAAKITATMKADIAKGRATSQCK